MLYNYQEFPKYVKTAGKITVLTAIAGLVIFLFVLVFDFGAQEFSKASAQTASTTLTVLNTPPEFVLNAYEVVESSTSSPTNSGDDVQWNAIATDSNGAPYFLLICSTNASPTPNAAAGAGSLGTAPPDCDAGAQQWGVSASTTSGTLSTVSTTTLEGFAESNDWFAWVCDDDPVNPRCNDITVQGYSATNSSPFNVNHRPVLTSAATSSAVDPGGTIEFTSVSSDVDSVDTEDEILLVVCGDASYNTTTNTCDTNFLASTTISMLENATATYTLAAVVRDDIYVANAYLVDEHGHEATANPISVDFEVNNVAPTVLGGEIDLNGGLDMVLTIPAGETPSSTLDFTIHDANSCVNAASGDEIVDFRVAVFRTNNSTTTCDGSAGSYDPNDCYSSGVATTTWSLSCTATSTCSGPSQDYVDYACEFPLWYIADPTDGGTPTAFDNTVWTAGVYGIDDDAVSGFMSTTTNHVDLSSFTAIDIAADEIVYGSIEPGNDSGTLSATSSALNVGNTGLDQEVRGDSMCGTYSLSTPCPNSATSTIPEDEQQFASSSLAYGSPFALSLSSTTDQEVELDVNKTISTSTPNTGTTYWGIAVPASVSLAGSYSGLNTYTAKTAEPADW